MDGMVAAGRVGGLFGNRGELTLVLYDCFPRDRDIEEPVFVEIDGHKVPLFFDSFVRRGVRGAKAVFADIDTEARADELVGREFYIRTGGRSGRGGVGAEGTAGSEGDELYFEDLVGWAVEVDDGHSGRVTAFHDSEFNPLLEIEVGGESVLIPAQDEFIVEADEQRRKIVLTLPEGLLSLNA